jgi:hypothetical protein
MRAALALSTAALAAAGCTSFSPLEPATPPDYSGPTVNVADQAVLGDAGRLHVFELTQVDGRRLSSTSMATVRAHRGRGLAAGTVALTNELPVQPLRLRLQAATQYGEPLQGLTRPGCRTVGEVAFTPEAGQAYRVAGRIGADSCEAWIENLATGQPATAKVSGPGTGR